MKNKGTLLRIITSTSVALVLSSFVSNPTVKAESNTSVSNESTIQKFIVDKNKLVKEIKIQKGDKVQFLIKSKVLNDEPITSIKLSDDIENVFDIDKNIEVYTPKDENTVRDSLNFKEDFNNITKQGVLKVNEDYENFEWIANNPNEIRGKTLYLVLNGTTKKDANYKKYTSDKGTLISNVAKEQINSQELTSNKVDVIIKSDADKKLLFLQNALAHQHISLDLLNEKKNKKATNINQIQQTSSKSEDVQNSNNKISNSHNKFTLNITSEEDDKDKNKDKDNKQAQDLNKPNEKDNDYNNTTNKNNEKNNNKDSLKKLTDNKEKEKTDKKVEKEDKAKEKSNKTSKEKVLPNTGMEDNIIFTLLGLLVSLISCTFLFKAYKNKKLGG